MELDDIYFQVETKALSIQRTSATNSYWSRNRLDDIHNVYNQTADVIRSSQQRICERDRVSFRAWTSGYFDNQRAFDSEEVPEPQGRFPTARLSSASIRSGSETFFEVSRLFRRKYCELPAYKGFKGGE